MTTRTAIPNKTRVNGVPDLRDLDIDTLLRLYPEKTTPMPIGFDQTPIFMNIADVLLRWFESIGRSAGVAIDVFIYYEDRFGRDRRPVAPDVTVAFDVDIAQLGEERSYFVERIGKPPEFVMEVGSPTTATHDVENKPRIYAEVGAGEYWMFDHTGGDCYGFALKGLRLVDGEYVPIEMTNHPDGSVSGYSAALGLTLMWDTERLQFINPETGQRLRLTREIAADETRRASQAETRASQAETRASQAETLASQAENRASQAENRASQAETRASQAESLAERERISRIQAENLAERERERRLQLEAALEELRRGPQRRRGNNGNDEDAK